MLVTVSMWPQLTVWNPPAVFRPPIGGRSRVNGGQWTDGVDQIDGIAWENADGVAAIDEEGRGRGRLDIDGIAAGEGIDFDVSRRGVEIDHQQRIDPHRVRGGRRVVNVNRVSAVSCAASMHSCGPPSSWSRTCSCSPSSPGIGVPPTRSCSSRSVWSPLPSIWRWSCAWWKDPLGKPVATSPGLALLPLMMGGALVMGIMVAFQHFLLFHSRPLVEVVTLVAAAGAYFLTRASLHTFEVAIRYHLGLVSQESTMLYKEIDG